MFRERPILSDDQRVRLATACLKNALNLMRESEMLVHDGALPYAQFLVGSAWEEVLKARYCIDEGGTWKTWWDGFRSHKTKLDLARRYWPNLPEDSTRQLLSLRERCLYVEVKADGDPLTPHGLVDPGGLKADFLLGWSRWIKSEGRATLERLVPPLKFTLPSISR
jgi:hypothetical protein